MSSFHLLNLTQIRIVNFMGKSCFFRADSEPVERMSSRGRRTSEMWFSTSYLKLRLCDCVNGDQRFLTESQNLND
jgi:hypothetical protein